MFATTDKADPVDQNRLPCYPDTVEVIEQQILAADTTVVGGVPIVVYRVILCVPEGVDLNEGRGAK